MKYTTLGRSGDIVSRLSLGAMTFGVGELVPGFTNAVDSGLADQMVGRSLDAGVNLFDTADMYMAGVSEELLGKALGSRRHEVLIATKVGFRTGESLNDAGLRAVHIARSVDKSLERLATDHIDVLFAHIPDPVTPVEETLLGFESVLRAGKVRRIGLSNFPAWQAARLIGLQKANGLTPFSVYQGYYSLVGRDIETDLAPLIEAEGLGLMTWSPLAGGFLTGRYTRKNPTPEGARRSTFEVPPVDLDSGYDTVDVLRVIARRHNASPAQVALAWQLSKPYVSSVIVGASTLDQLTANLDAANLELTAEDLEQLDGAGAPEPRYPGWMQPWGQDQAIQESLA